MNNNDMNNKKKTKRSPIFLKLNIQPHFFPTFQNTCTFEYFVFPFKNITRVLAINFIRHNSKCNLLWYFSRYKKSHDFLKVNIIIN